MFAHHLVALTALFGVTALAPAPVPKPGKVRSGSDLQKMIGRWNLVKLVSGKREIALARVTSMTVSITPTTWSMEGSSGRNTEYRMTLDSKSSPCQIDLFLKGGGNGMWGIYKFEGDTLIFCYGPHSTARPKDFDTASGTIMTMTLKRITKP